MACYKCGECCKKLYLSDRIRVSLKSKTLMLNKKCKFLTENNTCNIYNNRPKVCREWTCGACKR